jgi:branched-chain amino acid transport system permease protein
MQLFLQALVSGILIGGVYGLFSMGLSLIFGVMKIVNFAHGDFVMLAMYLAFFLAATTGIDAFLTIPLAAVVFFLLGVAVFRLFFARLVGGSDFPQLIVSLGLSLLMQNVALVLFKADPRALNTSYGNESFRLGAVFLNKAQLYAFLVALVITVLTSAFLRRTDLGKSVRATVDDADMASMLGVNPSRIFHLTFGLSSAMAAVAGCIIVTYFPVTPSVGAQFLVLAFVAVVLGGLGNVLGAFLGGLLIGMIQQVSSTFMAVDLQNAGLFVLFILMLLFRPSGILGPGGAR